MIDYRNRYVTVGCDGLVTPCTKPLQEPMVTNFYDVIGPHQEPMS